jgi:hypothetical protein
MFSVEVNNEEMSCRVVGWICIIRDREQLRAVEVLL